MITPEQIKQLPRKYAIGKRPLSRVLGWGELTYTRLLEGSTPTPQHEQELLRALNEPLTYMMLLDQAHDSGLISDVSYERSRKVAAEYVEQDASAEGALRMNAVARYLCQLAKGDFTPHALQLLCYYAHGLSFAQLDKPLFDSQPVAADDGPAYEAIGAWFTYERIAEAGAAGQAGADCGLTPAEIELLQAVFAKYGMYSAGHLQNAACSEGPWKKARKRAAKSGDDASRAEITAKSMKKWFAKAAK